MVTKFIDKKKVMVVGELNSTQSIVQEIFVDDKGNEVPHGENFTVQTVKLSDSPLGSWADINFEKVKAQYEKDRKEWERKIDEQNRSLRIQYDKIYAMTKSVQGMVSSMEREEAAAFIRLLDFMSGRINWAVIDHHEIPIVVPFEEFQDKYMFTYDRHVEGVKLITLFGYPSYDGKPKGLTYCLSQYSDGSGTNTQVHFYNEEYEAIDKAKELLQNKKYLTWKMVDKAKEWGVEIDEDKINALIADKRSYCQKEIEKCQKAISDREEELSKLEDYETETK